MSDATAEEVEEAPKASKMPMILGLIATLLGAGGGFFATFSGMILAPAQEEVMVDEEPELSALPDVAYIPIDPLVISIGAPSDRRHLRFRAQLEVHKKYKSEVETVLPRVVDVMNSYLRAVRMEDLEKTTALIKFRSQMLSRIDIVTGTGRVNDLLIMEFVMN